MSDSASIPNENDSLPTSSMLSKDKITLKLIIPSGKSAEFVLPYTLSVGEITEHVYINWPTEWEADKEAVSGHQILRLIYQGRFLHENVTFVALNIPPGKKTVMHLVPRDKLPQPASEDLLNNGKSTERSCCCTIV